MADDDDIHPEVLEILDSLAHREKLDNAAKANRQNARVALIAATPKAVENAQAQALRTTRKNEVTSLLVRGLWCTRVKHELRETWGVTPMYMQALVQDAYQDIKSSGSEETRVQIATNLEAILEQNQGTEDAKLQANSIKALELLAKLTGSLAPEQHVVRPVSREEALQELREAAASDPEIRAVLTGVLDPGQTAAGVSPDPIPPSERVPSKPE